MIFAWANFSYLAKNTKIIYVAFRSNFEQAFWWELSPEECQINEKGFFRRSFIFASIFMKQVGWVAQAVWNSTKGAAGGGLSKIKPNALVLIDFQQTNLKKLEWEYGK